MHDCGLLPSNLIQHGSSIVLILLVGETVPILGFVLPGTIILVVVGYMSAIGCVATTEYICISIIGLLIGDNLGYLFGRYLIGNNSLKSARLLGLMNAVTKIPFHKLLLFQFPAMSRGLVPIALGSAHYPYSRWLYLNLLASGIFLSVTYGGGYIAGFIDVTLSSAQTLVRYIIVLATITFALMMVGVISRAANDKN